MRNAQIIHNPSSGGGNHAKQKIIEAIEKEGYRVEYISTKNENAWKNYKPSKEGNIFVAGGDGTVTKMAERLLHQNPEHNVLLHILPYGTANNIAKMIDISTSVESGLINDEKNTKSFDCGQILGGPKEFFFESFGFGVFPELISQMKKVDTPNRPSEKLKKSLKVLLDIVENFKSKKISFEADGLIIEDSFILVELMNIQNLGPNLPLAANADPGDGYFDLVLIHEDKRSEFLDFLTEMVAGIKKKQKLDNFTKIFRVQNMQMKCRGQKFHVDDNVFDDFSSDKLQIKIWHNCLEFARNEFQ